MTGYIYFIFIALILLYSFHVVFLKIY